MRRRHNRTRSSARRNRHRRSRMMSQRRELYPIPSTIRMRLLLLHSNPRTRMRRPRGMRITLIPPLLLLLLRWLMRMMMRRIPTPFRTRTRTRSPIPSRRRTLRRSRRRWRRMRLLRRTSSSILRIRIRRWTLRLLCLLIHRVRWWSSRR